MTLLFIDGFDHYANNTDLQKKWTTTNSQGVSTTGGRRGGGAADLLNSSISKTVTTASPTSGIVGFAWKGSFDQIFLIGDATVQHFNLFLQANGTLQIRRGTTVLATSTFAFAVNIYYYLEVKFTINDTTGSVEVRKNGETSSFVSVSGADTQNGGTASWSRITLDSDSFFDDLYVCDTNGTTNNNFLGDCRVDTLYPNGNGNSSQFTGSDGNSTDNYLLVDETTPDYDTTYVESSTSGNKDTYTFTDLSHNPASIYGIQISPCAKKDDAGARSMGAVIRRSAVDYDGTSTALSTDYLYYPYIAETDPSTVAAWTQTNINAAEFGVKITA